MKSTLLIGACLLAWTSAASAADECGPLKIISTVDLQTPSRGAARVPVTIDGQTFIFRLATDGAQSAISSAAADKLKLVRSRSNVGHLDTRGEYSNTVATAPDFQIGAARFGTVKLRLMIGDPPPGEPDGWLGNDLLRAFDVELDFAAHKMNLISQDRCRDHAVYWPSKTIAEVPMRVSDDNRIIFKMMLDGHEIDATIESGRARTTLTRPVAETVFGLTETSPGTAPLGENFHYRFGKMSLQGLVVLNPDIVIVPDAAARVPKHGRSHMQAEMRVHQGPPLQIGLSTLRQLHVYIDYHNQTIYFTPANPDAAGATDEP